jgi:hypothetical protein
VVEPPLVACHGNLKPRSQYRRQIGEFRGEEGFGPVPCLVGIPSERQQLVPDSPIGVDIDRLDFRPLDERALLMDAAHQQDLGAGPAGAVDEFGWLQIARRTRRRAAIECDDPVFSAPRQVAAQRRRELAQARRVLLMLIPHFARRIDVIEIQYGDRHRVGRVARRTGRGRAHRHRSAQKNQSADQANPASWIMTIGFHHFPYGLGVALRLSRTT